MPPLLQVDDYATMDGAEEAQSAPSILRLFELAAREKYGD
jgi:hypothetical protein